MGDITHTYTEIHTYLYLYIRHHGLGILKRNFRNLFEDPNAVKSLKLGTSLNCTLYLGMEIIHKIDIMSKTSLSCAN